MTETPLIQRVRAIVAPIASDLGLDLYDLEQRGGTLRVTLDTRPGQPAGIDLDQLGLATRLISRELDHHDPIPGRYTLEVTSPGVERNLRTPAHFQREIGKQVTVRLRGSAAASVDELPRRVEGELIAADDVTVTVRDAAGASHAIEIAAVDRARTVFVWGPQPKPGQRRSKRAGVTAAAGADDTPTGSESESLSDPNELDRSDDLVDQ